MKKKLLTAALALVLLSAGIAAAFSASQAETLVSVSYLSDHIRPGQISVACRKPVSNSQLSSHSGVDQRTALHQGTSRGPDHAGPG